MENNKKKIAKLKLEIPISKEDFFVTYYSTINGICGLSNKEIVVLAALMEQYNVIKSKISNEDIINELLFSSRYRVLAREKADISDLNFNNYISSLKKKGVILEDANGFRKINPLVIVNVQNLDSVDLVELCIDFKIQEDEQRTELFSTDRASTEGGLFTDEVSEQKPIIFDGEESNDERESIIFFENPEGESEELD